MNFWETVLTYISVYGWTIFTAFLQTIQITTLVESFWNYCEKISQPRQPTFFISLLFQFYVFKGTNAKWKNLSERNFFAFYYTTKCNDDAIKFIIRTLIVNFKRLSVAKYHLSLKSCIFKTKFIWLKYF